MANAMRVFGAMTDIEATAVDDPNREDNIADAYYRTHCAEKAVAFPLWFICGLWGAHCFYHGRTAEGAVRAGLCAAALIGLYTSGSETLLGELAVAALAILGAWQGLDLFLLVPRINRFNERVREQADAVGRASLTDPNITVDAILIRQVQRPTV